MRALRKGNSHGPPGVIGRNNGDGTVLAALQQRPAAQHHLRAWQQLQQIAGTVAAAIRALDEPDHARPMLGARLKPPEWPWVGVQRPDAGRHLPAICLLCQEIKGYSTKNALTFYADIIEPYMASGTGAAGRTQPR